MNISEQKRIQAEYYDTQRALEASEQRFRRMFDSNVVGMIFSDRQGQIIQVNDRFLEMMGYTREEWEAKRISWDILSVHLGITEHLLEQGEVCIWEKDYYRKDGIRISALFRAALLPDSPGQTICVVVDISNRKCIEQENAQLRERLEFVLSSSPAVIFICKPGEDFGITFISDNIYNVTGYPAEAFIQDAGFWVDHLHPEDSPRVFARLNLTLRKGDQCVNEYRFKHEQGHYVWLRAELRLIRDSQGTALEMVGYLADITNRKNAEIKVRQQSHKEHLINVISQHIRSSLELSEILNTTVQEIQNVLQSDRVLVYQILPDFTGKVVAEAVVSGWPVILDQVFPENVFPRELYDSYIQGHICALSDRRNGSISPCLEEFMRNMRVRAKLVVPITVLQKESLWGLLIAHQCNGPRQWHTWEIELMQQLSSQLEIAIQQSQLYHQLNESHHTLAHTNAELIRATRLKDEFLANMSHELRTPLNAILGMSEGLLEEIFGDLNDRQQKAISTIERSGQHLLELINDILEVSKIAAGKLTLELSTVSISQLCSSSLVFVKQQAFKKQIQLKSIVPPDIGTIEVDQRRMRQVLINLLTNAVKFTPTEGSVTLEVHLEPTEINLAERVPIRRPPEVRSLAQTIQFPGEGCHLCISVMDTGIGISPEDQPKLFQPFIQIDSSLNRQYEGTGLGLALVKQIVEMHGGSVSLESELGKGSCFTVCLPYPPSSQRTLAQSDSDSNAASFSAAETDSATIDRPDTTPLILLAEDNEANISTLSNYLSAKGYRILCAYNGQEAIDLAKSHHPDLILMDIQMPVMDGLEAIRQIRLVPDLQSLPIIAITALAMPQDRQKCLDAGATEYVPKPLKLKQLAIVMQQYLRP